MNTFQNISSMVIPLIAIITAIIAYQQFYINKIKLRHDLYERRTNIYREILRFIRLIVQKTKISYPDLAEFWSKVGESEFIFSKNILDFIDQLYKKGVDLVDINEHLWGDLKVQDPEERKSYARNKSESVKWFFNQLEKTNILFKDYLILNENMSINPRNKGYRRIIISLGLLSSIIWILYYSIKIFKLDYLFNYKLLMYSYGIVLSFLLPYLVYKVSFWIIIGFKEK